MSAFEAHIHCDWQEIDSVVEASLINQFGFYIDDFIIMAGVEQSFVPKRHLTRKFDDPVGFKTALNEIIPFIKTKGGGVRGYIEAEVVRASHEFFPQQAYQDVQIPFSITTMPLNIGEFRQDEIHFGFNKANTDHRVDEKLMQMGFYPASCQEKYGVEGIRTIQGSREEVKRIWEPLIRFLETVGGIKNGYVIEEVVSEFWMSHPDVPRAPVIKSIQWT